MIDRVRRIVMGERASGESTFTHVEDVEPLNLGRTRWWLVWGWDEPQTLPRRDAAPFVPRSLFPPSRGVRVWAQRMATGDTLETEDDDTAEALGRLWDAEPAGFYEDPSRPGMHRTDSIDIGVVVSGEITTEADDGSTVALHPGDVYIQNGALHNWHANPDNPAHVVFILVGAERSDAGASPF